MINLQKIQIFKKILDKKSRRFNWQDYLPHPHLELKLSNLITHIKNKENAHFYNMDFSLVSLLIKDKILSKDFYLMSEKLIQKRNKIIQSIEAHTFEDKELLLESMSRRIPIEVMRITIKTHSGEEHQSGITYGDETFVGSQKTIEDWIHENIYILKKKGYAIKSIHIDHTHPSLEVFIKTKNKYYFVTNGLGDTDLLMAKNISDHLSYPLIISAIIPSGLKYSALF